jgi:probable rRNA maturation factor
MITFQSSGKLSFSLRNRKQLRSWIETIARSENREAGDLAIVFMNDAELLAFNRQYLKHDTLTDIITFDYSAEKVIHGDILISVERVRENALKFGEPFERELHRVIIHGVLHLCGYKDKKKTAVQLMRKKEDDALNLLESL